MEDIAQKLTIPWCDYEVEGFRPPEQMLISEWAERKRVLSEPSEEKGPLRLARTPYIRPILDAFLDPDVEVVTLCASVQVAKTEAMLSVLGYYADQEPCSILYVMADEKTARYMSEKRIQPIFENSPDLSRLIIPDKFLQHEATLANGAYIAMAWASSVSTLATRPMRVVLCDEIDKPGYYTTTNEAGPVYLATQRSESYFSRKLGLISSPTTEHGNIWQYLNESDVIFDWHVPCPFCGEFQPLRWNAANAGGFENGMFRNKAGEMRPLGQVVWDGGREASDEQIEAAAYECGACNRHWNTIQKAEAIQRGEMVARREPTGRVRKIGFHVNRLYSLLGKSGDLAKLVREWLENINDPQAFINAALAEPWRETVIKVEDNTILSAKADYPAAVVPAEAVALTCFVDVQKHGRWYAVRAWARDTTSWLVDYGFVPGWDEIEDILFRSAYPTEGGGDPLRIWRAAVDTGGGDRDGDVSMTEDTYLWLMANRRGKGCDVWGTKGASAPIVGRKIRIRDPLERTPSGRPLPEGLRIIELDTGAFKTAFFERLRYAVEGQPQGAYLHRDTDNTYLSHITAEEKRIDKKGVMRWAQIRKRNDLLDCEVGNLAMIDLEWPGAGLGVAVMRVENMRARDQRGTTATRRDRKW